MSGTIEDQLTQLLTDAHAIEEQALAQLRTAPEIAGTSELSEIFAGHLRETERQRDLVQARLEARGESPSAVEDALMRLGGKGFVLFARSQPDTPGKLAAHAFSYEHLEIALYELIRRVAKRAGDTDAADDACRILEEERAMAGRLAGAFDAAALASLEAAGSDGPAEHLGRYLADAHAIEGQSTKLLERATQLGGTPELEATYSQHLEETRHQRELIEARLEAHDRGPSKLKDLALSGGGLGWATFFEAQPDTPMKLAGFAYAFEHLEIAGYELLKCVARRAGDADTEQAAEGILAQERAAAERLLDAFDGAVDASLEAQGAGV